MTFRAFAWSMGGATGLALTAWLYVLFTVDPFISGWIGLLLFYTTLLATSIGAWCLCGVIYRIFILKRQEVMSREVRIAFRHAVLLSVAGVCSLALSAQNWLNIWFFIGLLVLIGSIEYMFLLVQESHRS